MAQHDNHQTEMSGSVRHHDRVFCSAAATRTAYALASIAVSFRVTQVLASIAVSFRVTQVVDIVRGIHAMIPKSLFTGELRRRIAVV